MPIHYNVNGARLCVRMTYLYETVWRYQIKCLWSWHDTILCQRNVFFGKLHRSRTTERHIWNFGRIVSVFDASSSLKDHLKGNGEVPESLKAAIVYSYHRLLIKDLQLACHSHIPSRETIYTFTDNRNVNKGSECSKCKTKKWWFNAPFVYGWKELMAFDAQTHENSAL